MRRPIVLPKFAVMPRWVWTVFVVLCRTVPGRPGMLWDRHDMARSSRKASKASAAV